MIEYKISDLSKNCNSSGTSEMYTILKDKWGNMNSANILRYKLTDLPERVVGDKYLIQLNPNRATLRRTPEHNESVTEPFNPKKFNFSKASDDEVIFVLTADQNELIRHKVLVNVSPMNKYHSLLCPFIDECLPQVVTRDSLTVALEIMFQFSHRQLRIGFNSLCAMASVNHLHYHLFDVPHHLPIEDCTCKQLVGPLYELQNYPIQGFCLQVKCKNVIQKASDDLYKIIDHFLKHNIAHNVMITTGESLDKENETVTRAVIWPRRSSHGVKNYTTFNVGVCELSGWFPVYDEEIFRTVQKEDLEKELGKCRLDDFDRVCQELKNVFERRK